MALSKDDNPIATVTTLSRRAKRRETTVPIADDIFSGDGDSLGVKRMGLEELPASTLCRLPRDCVSWEPLGKLSTVLPAGPSFPAPPFWPS